MNYYRSEFKAPRGRGKLRYLNGKNKNFFTFFVFLFTTDSSTNSFSAFYEPISQFPKARNA